MNVTTGEAINAYEALKAIAGKDLPVKCSYRLMRLGKKLESEVKTFETKRVELLRKYGEEMADKKGFFKVKDENNEAWGKDLTDLLAEKIEIEFEPVPLEMFGDITLTAIDLGALDIFIAQK